MPGIRDLLDALPFAVGVRRTQEGVPWSYVNVAMWELLGHEGPAALLSSQSVAIMADPPEHDVARERRRNLLRGERQGFHFVRWRRRDGSVVPVEVTIALIDFEGERAIMIVGRDLTERTELRNRLAIAERMASIGTLAAGVAHEINNPLTHLSLGLEHCARELRALAAERGDTRAAAIVESIDAAREGVGRVSAIVKSLKAMSRKDDDARVALDVRTVLETAIEVVRHQILHRARLVKAFGPVPPVRASAARLLQVFVNLLANAAQAIPVGRAEDNEVTVVTELAATGHVVVEVRDTGSGIPPELVSRVFDPFFTTKDIGEGTGLGLAICHGIVTSLGGVITVENRDAGGTVLRVALPQASGSVELPQPTAQRPRSVPAAERGRLLIVDDDLTVGRACRLSLEVKFDVTLVTSVREALDELHAGVEFDAILCDLMMPVRTGMDLYAELTHSHPRLRERMVFMTGGAFTESATTFLDTVPNLRVEKPCTSQELETVMTKAASMPR